MTPLLVFTLAWVGGVLLAQAVCFHPVYFLLIIPLALVLSLGWWDQRWARNTTMILLAFLLGAGRAIAAEPRITPKHVAFYSGVGEVVLDGVVRREPDLRPDVANVYLDVVQLTLPNGVSLPVHGCVLLKAPTYTPVRYGDRVQVTGFLEEPPVYESFSYRDYLARKRVYALVREALPNILASHQANPLLEGLYRFKAHAHRTLLSILPEPQASLLSGILLGVESGIPADLSAAFTATGTSHIVAISGFNLTIIAGMFAAGARRAFGRRGEAPVAIGAVWCYTLLVGASAAVMRAAFMATVAVIARGERRKTHALTSLAGAVFFMSLLNPYVFQDLGFQLSFAATLGLIFYTEPLTQLFLKLLSRFTTPERAQRIVGWLSDALIVTLAAQITTTPLIVATFRRASLVTLLTNFLILPLQTYVMLFGGLALVGALLLRPLGLLFAALAWVFLTATIAMVRWTATFPFASVALERVTLPLVLGYYILLLLGTLWWGLKLEQRKVVVARLGKFAQWQYVSVFASLALLFVFVYNLPDRRLHVFFLDVGHGDAVFVQTPHGRQVLIDGGADAPRTLSLVGRYMPFWDRHLDMIVLTSPDEERLAGLVPVLERYQVDFVLTCVEVGAGDTYAHWAQLLAAREPDSVGILRAGGSWDLDQGVHLNVLWPEENAGGPTVLQLVYGDTRLLLAGDATTVLEESLVRRYGFDLQSSVLLVPRHGSKSSATPDFLQAVDPEVAVISVAAQNSAGLPSPAVLARLMDRLVYRTDIHATIEFISNGEAMRVRTARSGK